MCPETIFKCCSTEQVVETLPICLRWTTLGGDWVTLRSSGGAGGEAFVWSNTVARWGLWISSSEIQERECCNEPSKTLKERRSFMRHTYETSGSECLIETLSRVSMDPTEGTQLNEYFIKTHLFVAQVQVNICCRLGKLKYRTYLWKERGKFYHILKLPLLFYHV